MLSQIFLIVAGIVIVGLMFYSFGIVLFSKNKYDNPKKADKEKTHATTEKFRGKFVGRS